MKFDTIFGKANIGVRCAKCKKEMRKKGQRVRQLTPMKWEADPKTPCECGSKEYESFVEMEE
jgi:hypothetical protein